MNGSSAATVAFTSAPATTEAAAEASLPASTKLTAAIISSSMIRSL